MCMQQRDPIYGVIRIDNADFLVVSDIEEGAGGTQLPDKICSSPNGRVGHRGFNVTPINPCFLACPDENAFIHRSFRFTTAMLAHRGDSEASDFSSGPNHPPLLLAREAAACEFTVRNLFVQPFVHLIFYRS